MTALKSLIILVVLPPTTGSFATYEVTYEKSFRSFSTVRLELEVQCINAVRFAWEMTRQHPRSTICANHTTIPIFMSSMLASFRLPPH
jgi:hypothetical protein